MHYCSNCEATLPHRDPDSKRGVATCPQCGSENSIPRVPLLVITGSSGCGKTTIGQQLLQKKNDYVLVDADFLCHDRNAFETWDAFWNFICIASLSLARNQRPIVLVGRANPSQIEKAATSKYFSEVYYFVFTCDEATQADRLRGRVPQGAPPPPQQSIDAAVRASRDMVNEANSRANATLLDNTDLTVPQATTIVEQWITDHLEREAA